jgi:ATP-dependent Lon protease
MELENYNSFPTNLPIIIENDYFLYPFMIAPLFLSDEKNIAAVEHAMDKNTLLFVVMSKPGAENRKDFASCYQYGVIGTVMRKVTLPDGRIKVLFQGLAKGKIKSHLETNPLIAMIDKIEINSYDEEEVEATLDILRDKVQALIKINNKIPADILKTIEDNSEPDRIADLVSSTLRLTKAESVELFIMRDVEQRLLKIIEKINAEISAHKIKTEIQTKVNSTIDKSNKKHFLRQQIKEIQKQLGETDDREKEIQGYRKKLNSMKSSMHTKAYSEISKQIDKLKRMHPDSADANTIQTYIETVLEIPFNKKSASSLSISVVKEQLDTDHYSLEKPKDRIVEYFAVKELLEQRKIPQTKNKATILCFAGPPGVGKTSLANSIASALKRKLIKIALGGVEDVNELRGHRRTYVGAMPGRVVAGLSEAKVINPVCVLDEIDKLGSHHKGDPSAVLLEILDPEQNSEFRDHYLNFPIDLSQIIFIATANDVRGIPPALKDRLEIIEISSYTPNEKYHIAKEYLIPQELEKHGLDKKELSIRKPILEKVIAEYTREAGVRSLRRVIAGICRKSARKILEGEDKVSVTAKNLKEFLDKTVFEIDKIEKRPKLGIVTGLAWTAVGGDVLKIEVIKLKGKGILKLTGSLGEVMKESAQISYTTVKTLIDSGKLAIDPKTIPQTPDEINNKKIPPVNEIYNRYDLHLHIPEGATPKDGPSAGITMATAIASILSGKKAKGDVAMTGELTLSGKVLPIGGLKEKLIAAYKAGVKTALIPAKNYEKDLEEIPQEVINGVEIIAVHTIDEVLERTLSE